MVHNFVDLTTSYGLFISGHNIKLERLLPVIFRVSCKTRLKCTTKEPFASAVVAT